MPRIFPSLAAVLCSATPVFAQNPNCAGSGGSGVWIGGTAENSDIATIDSFAEQMALVLNGNQYASVFTLSAPATTRIEAQGRGNGDPVLALFGPDGVEILTDDDSGGGGAARAEVDLDPGTYCAIVRSYDNAPMTAFVRIGRDDTEALTDGTDDTPFQPTNPPGAEQAGCDASESFGTLAQNGAPLSVDAAAADGGILRFDLTEPMAITITASNEDADPLIRLNGPDGASLGENDDYDGLNARLDMTDPLAPGTYCIGLDALGDPTLPITVAVTAYDPAAALQALYARGDAAPPMDDSYPITELGVLENTLQKDIDTSGDTTWFSVTMPESGLILTEANSIATATGDPWLVMFDAAGRKIAQNDDAGMDTNALMTARVAAGTYLIGLKQIGGGQAWVRLLMERFIPAP
ncbi:DVUA0089 family protein [Loktanella sp. SALINAS62]|uniref:DVUA0089 family protein n=1 Tax=Loktanella sp. SALINAS62 TaxID=2706124 RepID=UPI001B8D49EF|nr:DVUA0089 family protein [Loktanella sp. SALINAS62]MBS1301934.1 ABC transporter substrate-binding protein [Loktanella sp. SALINAS62]